MKNQQDLLNEFLDLLDSIYIKNRDYCKDDIISDSDEYILYRDILDSFIRHTNIWISNERERLYLIEERG